MISCRPGRSLRGSTTGQWAAARGRRGPDTGQPARSLNQSLQQVNKPCRVADSAHCPHRISVTNFCHLFRNFPKFQDASTSTFHWNEEINKISLIRLPHSIKGEDYWNFGVEDVDQWSLKLITGRWDYLFWTKKNSIKTGSLGWNGWKSRCHDNSKNRPPFQPLVFLFQY